MLKQRSTQLKAEINDALAKRFTSSWCSQYDTIHVR
jgi:hypothetical protein